MPAAVKIPVQGRPAGHPALAAAVEQAVREHGPISLFQLLSRLRRAGFVDLRGSDVVRVLRTAGWLRRRAGSSHPYVHADTGPTEKNE